MSQFEMPRSYLAVMLTLAIGCDPVSPPASVAGCYELRTSPKPENAIDARTWHFRPGGFGLPERVALQANVDTAGAVRLRGMTGAVVGIWNRPSIERLSISVGDGVETGVSLDLTWSGRAWRGIAQPFTDVANITLPSAAAEARSVSC